LFKFKYIDINNCLTCAEENVVVIDDINHSLVNCPVSVLSWQHFCDFFHDKFQAVLQLDPDQILFGFDTGNKKNNKIINETAIQIKNFLHKPMSIRKVISYNQIENVYNSLVKISDACKYMKIK